MEKNVLVTMKGKQDYTDNKDCVEFITPGIMKKEENGYSITYDETEMTGMEGSTTTLKVEGDKITLIRFGSTNSQLIFEKGMRHLGYYETPYGNFTIGTLSSKVQSSITDSGGDIKVSYFLEINGERTSANDLYLSIKEAGN